MAELATIFQVVQIGVESVYGTSGSANIQLQSLSIEPAVEADVKTFRATGMKFPTVAALGKEWTSAKIAGPATYTEAVYPFASVLNKATPTTAGSAGYLWTFTTDSDAADTVASYTVEQGDATRSHKFTGGLVNSFGAKYTRDSVEFSGSMIGKALQDGITRTSTPTTLALVPVLPTQVSVYLADSYAGLAGATALTRALTAEWELSDRYGPLWTLDASQSSYAAVVETEPKLTAKLKVEADANGMALITQLRSGATKFMRIKAVGDAFESGQYYTYQVDMALKVTEVSEFSDEDGVFAVEWTFAGAHDATWGKAFEVQLKNMIASL